MLYVFLPVVAGKHKGLWCREKNTPSAKPLARVGFLYTVVSPPPSPHRGQQFAQQMQQQNPELIEQLRSQIRSRAPSASNEEQQE